MMGLFKIEQKELVVNGVKCFPINKDTVCNLYKFYEKINPLMITAYQSIPMLVYGGNNYYNIVDDYLYLYHLGKFNSLVSVPFDVNGEYCAPKEILAHMKKRKIVKIKYVSEELSWLQKDIIGFDVKRLSGFGTEYVYDNKEMSECVGGDWKNFRNKRNKFHNHYDDVKVLQYNVDMKNVANELYERWRLSTGQKYKVIWDRKYFNDCLDMFPKEAFVVVVDGENAGIVSFSKINDHIVYGISRKLDPKFKYLAQYMQWWQANHLWNNMGIRYLNDGDDGDKPGLRDLKSGMNPCKTFSIRELILKEF